MLESHRLPFLVALLLGANPVLAQDFSAFQYRNIGPTRGGRVTAVAGTVAAPSTFYLGASGGGVWKTEDYGTTWRVVSDGYFDSPSIGDIAVAQNDANIVYVGTGSDGLRSNVIVGKGMYKSVDGLVHALADDDVAAQAIGPRADVDDVGVVLGHGDVTDGRRVEIAVGDDPPGRAVVLGLPDTTAGRAQVEGRWRGHRAGDRGDTPTPRRPDVPVLECTEVLGEHGVGAQEQCHEERQSMGFQHGVLLVSVGRGRQTYHR